MSTFAEILYEPLVQRWAMALMHFLWQGCIVVAITSLLLRRMRDAAPTTRYGTCLVALALLTAAPPLTFLTMQPPRPVPVAESLSRDSLSESIVVAPVAETVVPAIDSGPLDTAPSTVSPSLFEAPWETARAGLVAVWFVGELILGAWLLGGMVSIHIACRTAVPAPKELTGAAVRLSSLIGLSRAPQVFCARAAGGAASIGFFKPWILVPSAWVAQMTPEMLEAVLAHELMHIRRHDLWVNLFQRLAEVLLFFHPAVWWLSRRVREERELCCDAAAVRLTGKRKVYAQTLAHAAGQRVAESLFGLATNLGDDRMSLLNRVQWVLREQRSAARSDWWPAGIAAVLVPALLTFGLLHVPSMADERLDATAPVTAGAASATTAGQGPKRPATPIDQPPVAEGVAGRTQLPGTLVNGYLDTIFVAEDVALPNPFKSSEPGAAPSESNKETRDYVIEPPDILLIEVTGAVPKAPYEIQPQDVVSLVVLGTRPDRPILGQFQVASSGIVNLGPGYGSVKVAGLTTAEAAKAIRTMLLRELSSPEVAVSLFQRSLPNIVTGEHLVAPDGTVNLGVYGRVYVADMTIEEARAAIEKQLESHFETPKVTLEMFAYNSKFFYIVDEGSFVGNKHVTRMPVTGNETVLDAIAQMGGLDRPSERRLWIRRSAPSGGAEDQVLPIDLAAITRDADTSANYQLLPGDWLFVSAPLDKKQEADGAANTRQVGDRLNRYNRLVQERRIDEAVELAQAIKKAHGGSEIARLIDHHSQLLQALELQRQTLNQWLSEPRFNERKRF